MANGYYGDRAVKLPNMFQTPGQALSERVEDINRDRERKFEIDYRQSRDKQSEDWRKLNLIQELTDISKYQTGDDVADAIGYEKMNEVYQKYTAEAANMSPTELQFNVQKEMSSLIMALTAAKQELNLADDQLKLLKQKYPSLDIASLGKEYREEILGRRISNNQFNNPLAAGQSTFDISNPDVLSRYISSNDKLIKSIQSPQGSETMKIFKGTPSSYTEYTAKLNPWKKESFDRSSVIGGFLTSQGEPKLELKASAIPGLKSSDGKPFMVIDEGVYSRFIEDEEMNLQLIAAARNKFKEYDDFNTEEKNLAKRNVLFDKINEFDKSDYYPSDVKSPPRISVRSNSGSGGGKRISVWELDEYETEPDGGKNLTVPFQGYVFTDILGAKLGAKKVVYYPETKKFKITEYTGRDSNGNPTGEKTSIVSHQTLRQNIQGSNPMADMKEFDALIESTGKKETKDGSGNKENTTNPLNATQRRNK